MLSKLIKLKLLFKYSFGICFSLFCLLSSPLQAQQQQSLKLLLLTDQNTDFFHIDNPDNDQLARLSQYIANQKTQSATPYLTIQMGDMISPTLFSGFDQGAHLFDLMSALPLDMMVLSNHEFDFGAESLQKLTQNRPYRLLSDNLASPADYPTPNLGLNQLMDLNGMKVGFIGLTDTETPIKSSSSPYQFKDPKIIAQEKADAFRKQGADLIIALSHLSDEEESQVKQVAEIDFVLSYAAARMLSATSFAADSLPKQPVWEVTFAPNPLSGEWDMTLAPIDLSKIQPDPAFRQKTADIQTKMSKLLDIKIGTFSSEVDSRKQQARQSESSFANLVTDALRTSLKADIALMNAGSFRANRLYAQGTNLTRRDILQELPFGNHTILLAIPGKDLKTILENGVSKIDENAGRFLQTSGLNYEYDPKAPIGARITQIQFQGQDIDPDKIYRVATNNYMANGGDGFKMLPAMERLKNPNSGSLISLRVMAYIAVKGKVSPQLEGRITRKD